MHLRFNGGAPAAGPLLFFAFRPCPLITTCKGRTNGWAAAVVLAGSLLEGWAGDAQPGLVTQIWGQRA